MKSDNRAYPDNLLEAIESIDLNNYQNKSKKRILNSPWVTIPNVENFDITINRNDLLFDLFGIKKQLKPQLHFEPYVNEPVNRYLENQIRRLDKVRDNPNLYWAIAEILIKRSNSFRVAAIQHVFPKWHRNYPLTFIVNVNRKVSRIVNKGLTYMKANRVYIPKKETHRPLGVPYPEWRVVLHMYANFLSFFLKDQFPHQHGFLPGRGTLTAWKEIFERKLIEKDYIFEWDFKGFFDNIYVDRITNALKRRGVPENIYLFFQNVNKSFVELPARQLLNEARVIRGKRQELSISDKKRNLYDDLTADLNNEPYSREIRKIAHNDSRPYVNPRFNRPLANKYLYRNRTESYLGVAQGAPTSPILANLIMNLWTKMHERRGLDIVAYADDSVSFANKEISVNIPLESGILINPEKSGYVKFAGKWLKPLKFLGMEFDGTEFRAMTRKGSRLPMSEDIKDIIRIIDGKERGLTTHEIVDQIFVDDKFQTPEEYFSLPKGVKMKFIETSYPDKYEDIIKYLDERIKQQDRSHGYDGKTVESWSTYFKSRIIGFVQSRMYNGRWNLDSFKQDFTLRWVNKSWIESNWNQYTGELSVFNSTSIACHSLLEIFRWNQKLRKTRAEGKMVIRWIPTEIGTSFRTVTLTPTPKEEHWLIKRRKEARDKLLTYYNLLEPRLGKQSMVEASMKAEPSRIPIHQEEATLINVPSSGSTLKAKREVDFSILKPIIILWQLMLFIGIANHTLIPSSQTNGSDLSATLLETISNPNGPAQRIYEITSNELWKWLLGIIIITLLQGLIIHYWNHSVQNVIEQPTITPSSEPITSDIPTIIIDSSEANRTMREQVLQTMNKLMTESRNTHLDTELNINSKIHESETIIHLIKMTLYDNADLIPEGSNTSLQRWIEIHEGLIENYAMCMSFL